MAQIEQELFDVIADIGNYKDTTKNKDILKRRVESTRKKLFILKREDRRLIESVAEQYKDRPLTEIIEELKKSLMEKFKSYSEQELNDILLSL